MNCSKLTDVLKCKCIQEINRFNLIVFAFTRHSSKSVGGLVSAAHLSRRNPDSYRNVSTKFTGILFLLNRTSSVHAVAFVFPIFQRTVQMAQWLNSSMAQ